MTAPTVAAIFFLVCAALLAATGFGLYLRAKREPIPRLGDFFDVVFCSVCAVLMLLVSQIAFYVGGL